MPKKVSEEVRVGVNSIAPDKLRGAKGRKLRNARIAVVGRRMN